MMEDTEYKILKKRYRKLHKSNKELLDSIYYAERVQKGVLPHERHLKRLFSEYFVLYKPQGIIGGDLFWVGQKDNLVFFAVGDCTGHGASGAMLSILALSFLNYIVMAKNQNDPGEILNELDRKWIETFDQGLDIKFDNDWLEIGLCVFNTENRQLCFSGAFNKLFLVNSTLGLTELDGDKFPVGGWQLEKNRKFTTHHLFIESQTMAYLFTDGFKDQFGGPKNKRYNSTRFKDLLLFIASYSSKAQLQILETELINWMGKSQQTDDICVLGVRL